ncbi:GtrA family protein [Coprobacter tertius]|uniref:GtrA family protein n=1 Tax=Coprobacter tertius TaxID=2944915 RepID=A0ABT1MGR0_9BACT|nr:GtrA family protein [Coprobacter tertius]MCP9611810.1 GtrA family protein [Coprobacter tertius]
MEILFFKFIRFGIVGFLGMIIDFGITFLCKEKLKWYKYLSNSLGFIFAVCFNYYLNRIWTFHSQDPAIAKEMSLFIIISVMGLIINNFILYLAHSRFNISFYWAKFIAIGITFLWNFFSNNYITFS